MSVTEKKIYAAIDLKSFYASVECVERGLDPLATNLVVADTERTEKTICLAVSPSLKYFGVPGRPRLFEVEDIVRRVNAERLAKSPMKRLTGSSFEFPRLAALPELAVSYITAPPRMRLYMDYSSAVYRVYLRHLSAEDIHVYSVDEIFADLTPYLSERGRTPYELVRDIVKDIVAETGITATAGIGTNLYLAKVAMDISAKHQKADADGARIAYLDEYEYRKQLWSHRPLTDFWRIGRGYERRLASQNLYTMGDVARCSLGRAGEYYNAGLLYKLFGVNAELLIDHAWGYEPCTIEEIKAYRPKSQSVSVGQVLHEPYESDRAALIAREMAEALALTLTARDVRAELLALDIGYDTENVKTGRTPVSEAGCDFYGRPVPPPAHGSFRFPFPTAAASALMDAVGTLFARIADPALLVRRVNLSATCRESTAETFWEDDLFSVETGAARQKCLREERLQETILSLKARYGKNAVLKGMNLETDATMCARNEEIGGHRA